MTWPVEPTGVPADETEADDVDAAFPLGAPPTLVSFAALPACVACDLLPGRTRLRLPPEAEAAAEAAEVEAARLISAVAVAVVDVAVCAALEAAAGPDAIPARVCRGVN